MQKKYYLILFLFFIIGCVNHQEEKSRYNKEQVANLHLSEVEVLNVGIDSVTKVDLNPFLNKQSFDFGSMVKEVKLLRLETTNESLLDAIYKIVVTETNIFIQDKFEGGGIVIFDRKGKFIKRLPNGKGPGELNRLYDIAFDKDKNELIAYQHSFLLHFSPLGQFIKQERLPLGFYNFLVTPDGYVFKTVDNQQGNEHLGELKDYTLLVTDKKFKLKSVGLSCNSKFAGFVGYSYLYNNTKLQITHQYNDTIYQYNNKLNQLKAEYVLDYSKQKLPAKYAYGSWSNFESAVRQNEYFFSLESTLTQKELH